MIRKYEIFFDLSISNFYFIFLDECDVSSPCENGGTCLGEIDGFICNCTNQWFGDTCTGNNNFSYLQTLVYNQYAGNTRYTIH